MLEPTPEEVDSRAKSMRVVREVVNSIWPAARVLVFGSYETGLYTPASDTDIVVVESGLADAQKGEEMNRCGGRRWAGRNAGCHMGCYITRFKCIGQLARMQECCRVANKANMLLHFQTLCLRCFCCPLVVLGRVSGA